MTDRSARRGSRGGSRDRGVDRSRAGRDTRTRRAKDPDEEARTETRVERPARRRGGAGARPSGAAAGSPGRAKRPAKPAPAPTSRRRRRLGIAVLVLLLAVGGLVWVTVFSPTFDVREVRVLGAAPENDAAVEQSAAIGPGTSLLWLDGDTVADRVRTMPRIAAVDVGRDWPRTLVITVTEREPVLAVPAPGGFLLVDATGYAYRSTAVRPPGVPTLVLPGGVLPSPDEPGTRAAADVVSALPPSLRADITDVRGDGRFAVGFVLTGGREVRWGAATDNERKTAVLGALLTRPGTFYDVSTPELAVVR